MMIAGPIPPTGPTFHLHAMASSPKRSAQKEKLPAGFTPGEYSVICGRGKLYSSSPGNLYLRSLVKSHLAQYSNAKTKQEKSVIVSSIINCVREASACGAFVKQDELSGVWWEVDVSFAREKIGCIFRDILHKQYRSSTKAKQARKKKEACMRSSSTSKTSSARSKKKNRDVKNKTCQREGPNAEHNSNASPLEQGYCAMAPGATNPLASLEPLPLFEVKYGQTRAASSLSLRSHDSPSLLLKQNPLGFPSGSVYGVTNARCSQGQCVMPAYGQPQRRPLRFDIQIENQMCSSVVPGSLSVPGNSFKNALSSVLEDALGMVDLGALVEDEEDFPDDLSNIFDDDSGKC